MFQLPNTVFQPDERELDFLDNDWNEAWSEAAKVHEMA
jgi:hypothetical protein